MAGLVYDAGALIAADGNDRRMWAIHRRALERGVVPRIPAAVVTEAWRTTRQANVARLLAGSDVAALHRPRAMRAGQLLGRARGDDAIDATVVQLASERGDAVVTGDRHDLERIAEANGLRLSIHDI